MSVKFLYFAIAAAVFLLATTRKDAAAPAGITPINAGNPAVFSVPENPVFAPISFGINNNSTPSFGGSVSDGINNASEIRGGEFSNNNVGTDLAADFAAFASKAPQAALGTALALANISLPNQFRNTPVQDAHDSISMSLGFGNLVGDVVNGSINAISGLANMFSGDVDSRGVARGGVPEGVGAGPGGDGRGIGAGTGTGSDGRGDGRGRAG